MSDYGYQHEGDGSVVELSDPDGKGRSTPQPFKVDWAGHEKPDPDKTMRRRPRLKLKYRKVERFCLRQVDRYDEAMRPWFEEWRLNRDYYDGTRLKHWSTRRFIGRDMPWKQRLSPNVMKARIEQHAAIVLGIRAVERFRPTSESLKDLWSAQQADAIAAYQDRFHDPQDLRDQLLMNGALFGLGFVKTYYDQDGARFIGHTPEGEAVYEGLVCRQVKPPWEVGFDPDAVLKGNSGLDGTPWVFDRVRLSAEELRQRLDDEQLAKVVRAQRPHEERDVYGGDRESLATPLGDEGSTFTAGRLSEESYEVIEFYMRRSSVFPFGFFALLVNGKLIDAQTAAWSDHDREGMLDVPFSVFVHTPVPGQLMGIPLASLLRPLQDGIKKVYSSALEKLISSAKLKILMFGAGEKTGGWNDQHGQVIRFSNPDARVQVADVKGPTDSDYATAMQLMAAMDQVSHVFEPARGEGMGDRTTAREVSLLFQSSDRIAGQITNRLNRCLRASRLQEFRMIQAAYDLPRLVEMTGPDDIVITKAFSGADLAGMNDIEVVSDDILPAGRTAKIAAGIQLAQAGMMTPVEVRELIGAPKAILSTDKRIRTRARRAAMRMLEPGGVAPELNEFQRHDVYLDVMADIVESDEYEFADPFQKQMFLQHMKLRRQMLMLTMAPPGALPEEAAAMQASEAGGSGERQPQLQALNEHAMETQMEAA